MGKSNKPHDIFRYFNMHSGDPTPCWEWKGPLTGGKGRPYFRTKGKNLIAARVVYELVKGVIPEGQVVRHTCDQGGAPIGCCNPHHLELGTHQDNMNDMKQRDRSGLPATVVKAIRKLVSEGRTHADVAALYGVARETVTSICSGHRKSHVTDDTPTTQSDTNHDLPT